MTSRKTRKSISQRLEDAWQCFTVLLATLLGLVFLVAGLSGFKVALPKIGRLAAALTAGLFLTLGITTLIVVASTIWPRSELLRDLGERRFRELLVLVVILFLVVLVAILIFA